MTNTGKRKLHNVHSSIIALLTVTGLYIDGWTNSDWFFLASVIYWVYQPMIEHLEERLIDYIADHKEHNS